MTCPTRSAVNTLTARAATTAHALRASSRCAAPVRSHSRSFSLVCAASGDSPTDGVEDFTATALAFAKEKVHPQLVSLADDLGCDTSEGIFGFTPFSEIYVGRVAMLGFGVGMTGELFTGKGFLHQLGLCDGTPNVPLFVLLALAMGGGTAYATKRTADAYLNKTMPIVQFKRWAELLRLDRSKVKAYVADCEETKRIAALEGQEVEDEGNQEVQTPALSYGGLNAAAELEYAQNVEMDNGRWAMVGFALAILIESQSGAGVVAQLIGYMNNTGVLGPGLYEVLIKEFTQYRV